MRPPIHTMVDTIPPSRTFESSVGSTSRAGVAVAKLCTMSVARSTARIALSAGPRRSVCEGQRQEEEAMATSNHGVALGGGCR